MPELKLTLPRPHVGQQQVIDESKRFSFICCGRRWGKTALGIDRAVAAALKGQPVGWFSPSYRMLGDAWREFCDVLQPVITDRSQAERRLELMGGGSLEFWSLDSAGDAARGRRYALGVLDEVALVPDLEAVWQAVRPMLSDYAGGAYFLTTPRGLNHYSKRLFDRGMDPEQPDWKSWQMPTSANPFIRPEEIESARKDMSELAFSQEYEAAWVSWEGSVFRRIHEAILPYPIHPDMKRWRQPHWADQEAHGHVCGADWAGTGKSGDYTVFAVMNFDGVLVEIDRMIAQEYSVQRDRLRALQQRYRPVMILAESNSIGSVQNEALRRDRVPVTGFTTQNQTKAAIIQALALRFEQGTIKIPNDPVLIAELQSFEATTLPASGLVRYAAPEGQHDDCVISLALAVEALRRSRGYALTPYEIARKRENALSILLGGANGIAR